MADISWLSPCNGAVFSAGDTIHVKWKTSQPTACPSFKLCLSSELTAPNTRRDQNSTASNECGTAIWPVVKEGKGFYLTSLSAPSHVKSHHTYVLRMEGDSGLMSESPGFSLTPSNASASAPHTPDDPSLGASQAPFIARPKLSSPTHNIPKADASGSTRSAITHSAKASSFPAASQAPFITPQEASSPPQNISTMDASGKTRSAATGSSSTSSLPAASQLPFFVVHPQSPSPPRNMSAADASGRTHSATTLAARRTPPATFC
ncbi:hypothetical protein LshimejAT787_0310110 [Lyophyllum shimeji]|uniref:Uncharacterized protein n=1 Tax=Lyophyllum shimeji TaxID=47721 RepID=A0A9P3PJR1_LYOSH|nr:hypothetical protein LshimejAT787_0310110 [Lyophyllum shimeji]